MRSDIKSLVAHLLNNGFDNPIVLEGNAFYGEYFEGSMIVLVDRTDPQHLIPLTWKDNPVLVEKKTSTNATVMNLVLEENSKQSLWPNWIRYRTTNAAIEGPNPSRDIKISVALNGPVV